MTTSGQFAWNPEISDLLRECFERALMNPAHQSWDRISSAIRSANFTLQYFSNECGMIPYQLELWQFTTTQLQAFQVAPTKYLQPFTMTRTRAGVQIPVLSISRWDYEDIPSKKSVGATTEAFWDPAGAYAGSARTLYMWPVPENSTDQMRLWMMRAPEIVTNIAETPPIATEYLDAFCDDLALRIASKFNPQAIQQCAANAIRSLAVARTATRERAPVRMRMSAKGRRGWR